MNILFKHATINEDQARARWESIPADALVDLRLSRSDIDALLLSLAASLQASRGVATAIEALAANNTDGALSALVEANAGVSMATEAVQRLTLHVMATAESLQGQYEHF
ncbi:MAG: hypothetical protein LCH86_20775 [Proteobacteria bacterium]|nr:hypothetical protein [Pseudomonadota bacterium]